jgi:fructose-1-phosphate kinase PfkB-like protein
LNPAYQKILTFSALIHNGINRANSTKTIASGKGINFCRALKTGGKSDGTVYQFLGGETGTQLSKWLNEENISHISQQTKGATRTCITCLEKDKTTEIIEPTEPIAVATQHKLLNHIKKDLSLYSGVAICGTTPNGVQPTFYSEVIEYAKNRDVPILLDSFTEIKAALSIGVTILKINFEELQSLTAKNSIKEGIAHLHSNYSIPIIAITNGAKPSFISYNQELYQLNIPHLKQVVNPIGAGDTTSALFFSNYLDGVNPVEAFALGVAAASASCLNLECAIFNKQEQLKLKEQIKIEKV